MKDGKDINKNTEKSGESDPSILMLMSTCVKFVREGLNSAFIKAGNSLTFEQWRLLAFLAEQDGVSQLDLARMSDRTEVSVLNLLKKLEERELVIRQRDPVDARSKRVFLTVEGRRKQKELLPIILKSRARFFKGLEEEDLNILRRTLTIIIENTKQFK